MLFNSFDFLIFAPLVLIGHALLRGRSLRLWLVVASYVFYGWAIPVYCTLLFASTLLDFSVGLGLGRARTTAGRKAWLLASLVGNLGLLGYFKYVGFFARSANELLQWTGAEASLPVPDVLLPIGISFYTFQTLSYTIDVYRGRLEPTRSFTTFALYVAFFPQLVAGPIERATHLLHQLEDRMPRDRDDVISGISRILWGLFKKIVMADSLGMYVNHVYATSDTATPAAVALAAWGFAFQIYFDFSAYSDIAIGLARIMGIRLRENFRWPFLARDMPEFWRRWHISFSSWLRDYVYAPLGGNRRGPLRTAFNAILVVALGGLWHGAAGHFVLWGLSMGLVIALSNLRAAWWGTPRRARDVYAWRDIPGILLTFNLFSLSTVLFRSQSAAEATELYRILFSAAWLPLVPIGDHEAALRAAILLLVSTGVHTLRGLGLLRRLENTRSELWIGLYWGLVVAAIALLHAPVRDRFIYYQF